MLYQSIVSFVLGIVFEKIFGLGWSASLLVALVSFFIFLIFVRRSAKSEAEIFSIEPKIFLAVGLAIALGILRMSFADISPDPGLSKSVGQKIYFEAVISDEPDVRDLSARYTVSVMEKNHTSKSLVLLIADRFPELKYGDRIKVSGKLELSKNFESGGVEFDYLSFLAKDKIHFLIYHPAIEMIGSGQGSKIISSLYSVKNIFINKISAVVPEPNSSFLAGIIFGAKQSLGADLLDDFKKVGLIHIVVLSGYNITLIAAGVFYVFSFFGKRNLSFVASVIFISLFALMVGLTATVIRACIMAFIAILARFLGRPSDALRFLFIAALFMLFWNPLLLFYDPSFQLSFMATLGLILFSPFILFFISERKFGKFIPVKFGFREIVASTFAVQLFVLPLLIKMSGFISLISFIVNPLVLPLVPLAMASGALTGALGIISQILSWPFGAISYFISQIIISATELSAALPFAALEIGALPWSAVFLWYLGYGFIFWKLKRKNIYQA